MCAAQIKIKCTGPNFNFVIKEISSTIGVIINIFYDVMHFVRLVSIKITYWIPHFISNFKDNLSSSFGTVMKVNFYMFAFNSVPVKLWMELSKLCKYIYT